MQKTQIDLDPVSDTAIMFAVKAGDIDKLGLLYERYHRMLFGFFWRSPQAFYHKLSGKA
jgi:hypothetical protein